MARKIFDVRCPNDHVSEVWQDTDERVTPCPQCGEDATRQISVGASSISLDVCSGDFPGATAKWLRDRERKMAKERRTMDRHGTPF